MARGGYDGRVSVFLLAGQSNMAGRGGTFVRGDAGEARAGVRWDGVVPEACRPRPEQILAFNAAAEWAPAAEPLHEGIDTSKACGVGPGMAFARRLQTLRSDHAVIGLVPCAVGNTSMDQWAPGGELFENAIQRTRAALASLRGARLSGLLWYQGESDCDCDDKAAAFSTKLPRLLTAFRERLYVPELPIVQVAVHTTRGALPFVERVRAAQLALRMPGVATVDARPHARRQEELPDELHLSTEAQCALGQEIADRLAAQLLPPNPSDATKT